MNQPASPASITVQPEPEIASSSKVSLIVVPGKVVSGEQVSRQRCPGGIAEFELPVRYIAQIPLHRSPPDAAAGDDDAVESRDADGIEIPGETVEHQRRTPLHKADHGRRRGGVTDHISGKIQIGFRRRKT